MAERRVRWDGEWVLVGDVAKRRVRWDGEWVLIDDTVASGVIDNFEAHPDGVYKEGESFFDYWNHTRGDSDFEIVTDPAIEGSQAVMKQPESTVWFNWITSMPGGGLEYYPVEGDIISGYLYDANDSKPCYGWYADDAGEGYAYLAILAPAVTDDLQLRKLTDGGTSELDHASSGGQISTETWYDVETEIRPGGEYHCSVYDVDQSTGERTDPENPLVSATGTDTEFSDNEGVLIGNRSTDEGIYAVDGIRKVGEVSN